MQSEKNKYKLNNMKEFETNRGDSGCMSAFVRWRNGTYRSQEVIENVYNIIKDNYKNNPEKWDFQIVSEVNEYLDGL